MAKRYGVGIIGNCCTHGEFVAFALKRSRGHIVAGWEDDPRRTAGCSAATGLDLASSPDAVLEDPAIDIVALACSPHEKAGVGREGRASRKHVFLNKPMAESLVRPGASKRQSPEQDSTRLRHSGDRPLPPGHGETAREVRAGRYGRAVNYTHTFSFTFSTRLSAGEVWPERLDPASRSGGGELTNLGCYAVDYMIGLWGRPRSIQAKSTSYWDVYREAGVENFGQVIADYGDFFAVLASGKQPLENRFLRWT